jgi:hypothetical protein
MIVRLHVFQVVPDVLTVLGHGFLQVDAGVVTTREISKCRPLFDAHTRTPFADVRVHCDAKAQEVYTDTWAHTCTYTCTYAQTSTRMHMRIGGGGAPKTVWKDNTT